MRSFGSAHFLILVLALGLGSSACIGPFAAQSHPSGSTPSGATVAGRDETRDRSPRSAGASNGSDDCDDGPSVATADDDGSDAEHTTLDDGFDPPPQPATPAGPVAPAPFSELKDAEIEARLRADIGALGPMSIGRTNGGALVAGVRMPQGPNWDLVSPGHAWGTKETIDGLAHAIDAVAARFPGTPKEFIGDIGAKDGGHLHPHVSHQSGRDVDLGYYLTEGHRWYANASGSNLDRARTWHLVRTLIADSDIDLILIDLQIQRALKAYALEIGENRDWLDQIFQAGGKSQRPLIFHANGHATHLHVRFYSPVAQELGRRAYRFMIARHVVSPPTLYITHTVKQGETLSHLALRYKVTAEAIKKANALTKDLLRVDKPYKIPQRGGIALPVAAVIPARRAPPSPNTIPGDKPASGADPCRRASRSPRNEKPAGS